MPENEIEDSYKLLRSISMNDFLIFIAFGISDHDEFEKLKISVEDYRTALKVARCYITMRGQLKEIEKRNKEGKNE